MISVAIFLAYSEVFGNGEKAPFERAVDLIKGYPLYPLLRMLSAIDIAIVDPAYEDTDRLERNQVELCRRILEEDQFNKVNETATRLIREETGGRGDRRHPPIVVFNQTQLVVAIKIALLHCSTHGDFNQRIPFSELFEALLIISDYIDDDPEHIKNWYEFYLQRMQFMASDHLGNFACRWNILIKKVLQEADSNHPSLQLRRKYMSKYKIEPSAYSTLLLGIYWLWSTYPKDQLFDAVVAMPVDGIQRGLKISRNKLNKFLRNFCRTADEFRIYLSENPEVISDSYNNKVLSETPLIRYGDRILCLNRHFLSLALASGFYHEIVKLFTNNLQSMEVKSVFGKSFHEYALNIFDRMFDSEAINFTAPRVIPGDEIPIKQNEKRVDAIIDYGKQLILVEFKSAMLPKAAYHDVNHLHVWEYKLSSPSGSSAAEQIDNVIKQIEKGKLKDSWGIDPNKIIKYYPLLVTLQRLPTPMDDYIEHVQRMLDQHGWLQNRKGSTKIARLELMHVSELETIEVVLESGQDTLLGLIQEKIASRISDWNAFLVLHKSARSGPNEFLRSKWNEIINSAAMSVFKREVSPQKTP